MDTIISCPFRRPAALHMDVSRAEAFLAVTPLAEKWDNPPTRWARDGDLLKVENGHLREYLGIRVHKDTFSIKGRHSPCGLAVRKKLMMRTEPSGDVVGMQIIGWRTVMLNVSSQSRTPVK
jgi:hypothetical protein